MGLQIEWPDFPQHREDYVRVDDEHVVPGGLDGVVVTETDAAGVMVIRRTFDIRFDADGARASRVVVEEGTRRLDKALFSNFDPDDWARRLLADYGFHTSGPGRSVFTPDEEATWAALKAMPKRRSVTKRRLEEVAAAHERGGGAAVQRDCNVSKSQAYRLIDQARKAGVLPAKEN